jgi:predicted RNA-binding Zn-ribbon protein involved in translation (DUF1610 family)
MKAKRAIIHHAEFIVKHYNSKYECPHCYTHFEEHPGISLDITRFKCTNCGREIIAEHKPKEKQK